MSDIELEQLPGSSAGTDRILIREDYIGRDSCAMLCDYVEKECQKQRSIDYRHDRTAFLCVPGEKDAMLKELCFKLFSEIIEPFFGVEIEWWEQPQLLRYALGGEYTPHSDSEMWVSGENPHWRRVHDRDISILLYLNEDFAGGKLTFMEQNLTLSPKPGLLVAFPSNHDYQHAAEPTEEGLRYVMVTWAGAKGYPRVRDRAPIGSVFMNEYRKKI